jgi:hypothetical protein
LTPFSERSGAALLKDIAAVEVAVLVEVVVERGVYGGELLKGLHVPEIRHRRLSSSERLMRIFGPIVVPTTALLSASVADRLHRGTV